MHIPVAIRTTKFLTSLIIPYEFFVLTPAHPPLHTIQFDSFIKQIYHHGVLMTFGIQFLLLVLLSFLSGAHSNIPNAVIPSKEKEIFTVAFYIRLCASFSLPFLQFLSHARTELILYNSYHAVFNISLKPLMNNSPLHLAPPYNCYRCCAGARNTAWYSVCGLRWEINRFIISYYANYEVLPHTATTTD